MTLEPNMYVRIDNDIRTICIGIGKIKKIASEIVYVDIRNNLPISFEINQICKASHNIIDLIEVGDIVTTKHLGLEKEYIEVIDNETSLEILKSYFKEKSLELISVVTKQQFESMQYEVK